MIKSFRRAPAGVNNAWARSLQARFALVPLVGAGAALTLHSPFGGLAIAVLMAVSVTLGTKLQDERRRRRAAREHIAGLSRW